MLANIDYRRLQVEQIAPLHGDVAPYSRFLENVILATQFLPADGQPSTR